MNDVFEVEFMSLVIDKADNFRVTESDSHFSDFVGMHPSKIRQGKLFLPDIIHSSERETVIQQICKKNSPYVYLDFYIKNKKDKYVLVHCAAQNSEHSSECFLTLADVSRTVKQSEYFKSRAEYLNRVIDLIDAGICIFKVNSDMRFEALYMNAACCALFGTGEEIYRDKYFNLDDLIFAEDKSKVFQAVGRCMATEHPIDTEVRVLTHRDKYVWCRLKAAIHRYDEEKHPVFHATLTDISDYKK